jgi:hypothetical protein
MTLGYIDLTDINHLQQQALGGGVYEDRAWRESYYFVMSDPKSGLSLISTIGFRPPKNRTEGFVLVIKNGKPVFFKLLFSLKRPVPNKYQFKVKGLEYSVEGAGWRLRYHSNKCSVDILFTPVNKIHDYITDPSDRTFERIGSQHYEQSGSYEGTIELDGQCIKIEPCFGHRDHSWGIRDWSAVRYYRLFCCAFSKDLAFNLWEGKIGSKDFLKGYVFDGEKNIPIVRSKVKTVYGKDGKTPQEAVVELCDSNGKEYKIECKVLSWVPFPIKRAVLHETIAKMRCNGKTGQGLLEYLYHEVRPLTRATAYVNFLGML